MKLFNKKKEDNTDVEFSAKDHNAEDKLQVVISRLENNTKVTIAQFWAKKWEDPQSRVAYWINDKKKFKQPLSDYYLSTIKSDIKDDKDKVLKKLKELRELYQKEKDADKINPNLNLKDIEHDIEVLEHQDFLLKYAGNGYSVMSRNLENYRKVEYLDIGNKLYPLAFNPKFMTYFIIPIDKDITLDKHRENVTLKHTTAFQKLIASATILMLILTCVLALIVGIAGYKLYFAYDETKIAEIERVCASSSMLNMEQYTQATQEFKESTKDFVDFTEKFRIDNTPTQIKTPQTQGDLN